MYPLSQAIVPAVPVSEEVVGALPEVITNLIPLAKVSALEEVLAIKVAPEEPW